MKIAVISDVHGNYPALKAVLKQIDEIQYDCILSLGDVSGYYCMVNECIDEFRKRNIINLLGNHDSYLVGKSNCTRSRTVNQCIEFQRSIISRENFQYLAASAYLWEQNGVSARHGGWSDPIEEYVSEFDFSIVSGRAEKIYCSGHTHIQVLQRERDIIYFNPGSVGQPRDGDCRAGFAVLDSTQGVKLYRVNYNIDEIANKMMKNGFPKRIYDCLYYGCRIGQKTEEKE